MKYFRLNAYCHLVEGKVNGCIYNLINGNMIILNKQNQDMLRLCEKNIGLENIPGIDYDLINRLEEMNIGQYYSAPVYIDKYEIGQFKPLEAVTSNNHEVNTVFIELNNACNLNCVFCENGGNSLFRKTGCKRWGMNDMILSFNDWKSIISQASKLNCKHLIFIGGEPFLQEELLKKICSYAVEIGIMKISIYINGSLLTYETIKFMKLYNIELIIQIFGFHDDTYKKITGMPNMGTTIYNNVKKLAAENINYKLSYLVNKYNEEEIELTFKEYSQFTKYHQMETEFIYPIPENNYYSPKYLNLMYDKKSNLRKAGLNVKHFCNAKKQHNCYGNQIGITADGDVLPCIMSRSFVLGNVKEEKLSDILCNKKYEYFKKLNKDAIDKCKSCALKFGCFDCRALEYSATGNVHGLEYCNI